MLLKASVPVLSRTKCTRIIERMFALKQKYRNGSGNGILCGFDRVNRSDACQVLVV
jgi:hypothetical protein